MYTRRFVFGLCIVLTVQLYGANSARYLGISPADAGVYLDNSQNAECDGCADLGHPRAHASYPNAVGTKDSVENYSRLFPDGTTGFLSRNDQNYVAHHTLNHQACQEGIALLNKGKYTVSITLAASDFPPNVVLPKIKQFRNGRPIGELRNIERVVVVLKNYPGKRGDRNSDVFIYTLFPRKTKG